MVRKRGKERGKGNEKRGGGGGGRGVYRILVGKPEVKRPLARSRCRWENNIKMDLSGSGMWGYGLDRADSRQGQMAGTCECDNVPSGSIKCGEFLD